MNATKRNRYRYILSNPCVLNQPVSQLKLISSHVLHQTSQVQVLRILIPNDMILEKADGDRYYTTTDSRLVKDLSPVVAIKINNHWKPQTIKKIDVTNDFTSIDKIMLKNGYKKDAKIGYYKQTVFAVTNLKTEVMCYKMAADIKTAVDVFVKDCETYGKLECDAKIVSNGLSLIQCIGDNETVENYRINKLTPKQIKQKQATGALTLLAA